MHRHKCTYEKRIASNVERKLKLMLAGLNDELRAGHVPADFKVRMNAIYQEIIGEYNYIYMNCYKYS
jgi:hypothetical protein